MRRRIVVETPDSNLIQPLYADISRDFSCTTEKKNQYNIYESISNISLQKKKHIKQFEILYFFSSRIVYDLNQASFSQTTCLLKHCSSVQLTKLIWTAI